MRLERKTCESANQHPSTGSPTGGRHTSPGHSLPKQMPGTARRDPPSYTAQAEPTRPLHDYQRVFNTADTPEHKSTWNYGYTNTLTLPAQSTHILDWIQTAKTTVPKDARKPENAVFGQARVRTKGVGGTSAQISIPHTAHPHAHPTIITHNKPQHLLLAGFPRRRAYGSAYCAPQGRGN